MMKQRIDLGDVQGNVQLHHQLAVGYTMRLIGDVSLNAVFDNLPIGTRILVSMQQDSVGGHAVTWPSNILWLPTPTPSMSPESVLLFELIVIGDFFDMWSAAGHVIGSN